MIPGYTHLRRAQPVLWPHYLLAYFEMFARDHERFGEARRRANVMPLGSGALAGSGFPHDREAIARDLGFDAITRNSMDVSADRDFALDYLYAASVTMIHLSRLAEDWILYSSEEFGWMELGDGVTSGSSLMPQKKNPDSLELIRGKSGRVLGALNSLLFTMKGLPMTYNRDMQEDKEPLFEAADQVNGCLEMARAVAAVGGAARADPGRRRPRKAGWSPPTSPKRWRATARRSTRRIRSSGRLVLESVRSGKQPGRLDGRRAGRIRPRIHARNGASARSPRGHEDARDPWRNRPRNCSRGACRSAAPADANAAMMKSFRQGQILKLIRAGVSSRRTNWPGR